MRDNMLTIKNYQISYKYIYLFFAWCMIIGLGFLELPTLYPFVNVLFLINLVITIAFFGIMIFKKYNLGSIYTQKQTLIVSLIIGFFFTLGNLFMVYFIGQNRKIYFWDQVGYWTWTIQFSNSFFETRLIDSIFRIYSSVLHEDYNLLPTVLITLPVKLFGFSFSGYTDSIYLMYLIPFYIAFILFINKIISDLNKHSLFILFYIVPMSVFLFPSLLIPALNGYADSIGLSIIILVFIIIYNDDFSKFSWRRNIELAILLTVLALSRRWYAYWVVGFFVSISLTSILSIIINKKSSVKNFLKLFMNILSIGIICLLILVVLFRDFLMRSVLNNYSTLYSAYKVGDTLDNIIGLINYFGIPVIIISLIGLVYSFLNKKTVYFSTFVIIQFITIFFLFLQTQSFGRHHYYLLVSSILYFFIMGIVFFLTLFKKKFLPIRCILISVFVCLIFYLTFFNTSNKILGSLKPIFTQENYYPSIRNDLDVINQIYNFVNQELISSKGKAYILSSSPNFTEDTLRYINMPNQLNAMPQLETTMHIDKRDGFPNQFLLSDIVLIADPIQFHLEPENQKIIGVLAKHILEGSEYGKHYRKINEFVIDNNIKINIYKKKEGYDEKSINFLLKEFHGFYPDYPPLFNINKLGAAMYNVHLGDTYGLVNIKNSEEIHLHPGEKEPTSFTISLNGEYKQVSFDAALESPNQGEVNLSIYNNGKLISKRYLTPGHKEQLKIDTTGINDLKVTIDSGKDGPGYDTTILNNIYLEPLTKK